MYLLSRQLFLGVLGHQCHLENPTQKTQKKSLKIDQIQYQITAYICLKINFYTAEEKKFTKPVENKL